MSGRKGGKEIKKSQVYPAMFVCISVENEFEGATKAGTHRKGLKIQIYSLFIFPEIEISSGGIKY